MNNSWGHTITLLTSKDIDRLAKEDEWWIGRYGKDHILAEYNRQCKLGKCRERAKYHLRYNYVTGRAGRVSYAEKNICEKHAQKYLQIVAQNNKVGNLQQQTTPA